MDRKLLEKRLEVVMDLFGPNGQGTPDFGRYTMQGASVKSVSLLPDQGLRFSLVAGANVINPGGNLHGGAMATLIDVLTSLALHVYDENSRISVSTNLNIEFIAGTYNASQHILTTIQAAPAGTELIADVKVLKTGKTLSFTEMEIRNKNKQDVIFARGAHTKFMLNHLSTKSVVDAKL